MLKEKTTAIKKSLQGRKLYGFYSLYGWLDECKIANSIKETCIASRACDVPEKTITS